MGYRLHSFYLMRKLSEGIEIINLGFYVSCMYNYEIYLHRTAYLSYIPTWMNSINNVPTLSRSANAQRRKFKYCGTVKIPLGVYMHHDMDFGVANLGFGFQRNTL